MESFGMVSTFLERRAKRISLKLFSNVVENNGAKKWKSKKTVAIMNTKANIEQNWYVLDSGHGHHKKQLKSASCKSLHPRKFKLLCLRDNHHHQNISLCFS